MREILFRGKRIETGKWVEGYLIRSEEKAWIAANYYDYHYEVLPETVGQYIGINDVNGTKIFENDIVKKRKIVTPDISAAVVIWVSVRGAFALKYRMGTNYYFDEIIKCKEDLTVDPEGDRDVLQTVIGNIQDNPELVDIENLR